MYMYLIYPLCRIDMHDKCVLLQSLVTSDTNGKPFKNIAVGEELCPWNFALTTMSWIGHPQH